jgi:hypothetical protein
MEKRAQTYSKFKTTSKNVSYCIKKMKKSAKYYNKFTKKTARK